MLLTGFIGKYTARGAETNYVLWIYLGKACCLSWNIILLLSPDFNLETMHYQTKQNAHIRTFGDVFGSLESVECLMSEHLGSCSFFSLLKKSQSNRYMYDLIQKCLIPLGYIPMENLYAATYDWRLDPQNGNLVFY
jgi:hypothetical protein